MNNNCSKYGAETNYDGDLHCREIFIGEIKKLLLLNDFKKARVLYFAESFDITWKEKVVSLVGGNFEQQISAELREIDIKERHRIYLNSLYKVVWFV